MKPNQIKAKGKLAASHVPLSLPQMLDANCRTGIHHSMFQTIKKENCGKCC